MLGFYEMKRKPGPKNVGLFCKLAGVEMVSLGFKLPWYCLNLGNGFASARDELEDTIKQQSKQIEELERDKDQLNSSLVQSRERISYLQQEVKINVL